MRRTDAPVSTPPPVLVLSQASLVVFLLQDALGEGAEVAPLSSEAELIDRLRRRAGSNSLIVVDRRHPVVGPGVCRVLRDHVPRGSTIVWWGADEAESRDVEDRMAFGAQVIATESDMELADLGELCRGLAELL